VKVTEFEIPGLLLIEPKRFGDARGWFSETWQAQRYRDVGVGEDFVQDNMARSSKGVLRGLHAQQPHAQGKLVQVIEGSVLDVAVDLRLGSPTFGQWQSIELNAEQSQQFYVPPGFGHGYYVLSDTALFSYKCTDYYHPEAELAIRWDDPDIGVDWQLQGEPVLSDKDRDAPLLKDVPQDRLEHYG